MSKKIFEDLIKDIIENNDPNINAANKDTIHDLLQVYFYRLSKQELFEIAELAFRNNKANKVDLFKIALTCYTLALIKTDININNLEFNKQIFEILGKEFGEEIKKANITFNGHINEPYSAELSKIEKIITANAFIGEDISQLIMLSDYYFSLALGIGNKECVLNPTINAIERNITLKIESQNKKKEAGNVASKAQKPIKADGNPVYLWKSISYLSLAASVTRNHNKKMEFEIEKLLRVMHATAKFYYNKKEFKRSEQLTNIYSELNKIKDWLQGQKQALTSEQKSQGYNSINYFKGIIKNLKNEKINSILENAAKRENDIMSMIFHIASEEKSEPIINPHHNNQQNIEKVTKLFENKSLDENTIGEYQVVLKQQMDQNLQTLEDGKQVDASELPAPEHPEDVKYNDALNKIRGNTALLEFYLSFEHILTQCTLGSFVIGSGKVALEPGVLAKIGNLLGATGTVGSIVGSILSIIDEEKQKEENKRVAEFASTPKMAQEIFSYAAITLALKLESEIINLSVKTPDTSYVTDKLSAPAGAVSFGATLALIALPTLASRVDTKTSNEDRAKLLVNTVMKHQPSKVQKLVNKVSKFTALSNMLATQMGNIQKFDGTLVHYSELLKNQAAIVEVAAKITKEELENDLATLKTENGMLQDKNINLKNEVETLKATVEILSQKIDEHEKDDQALLEKLSAHDQLITELKNQNEELEKNAKNSQARILESETNYRKFREGYRLLEGQVNGIQTRVQNLPEFLQQVQQQPHFTQQIPAMQHQLQQQSQQIQQMQQQMQSQFHLIQQMQEQMQQMQQQLMQQAEQMQYMQQQMKQPAQQVPQQPTNGYTQQYQGQTPYPSYPQQGSYSYSSNQGQYQEPYPQHGQYGNQQIQQPNYLNQSQHQQPQGLPYPNNHYYQPPYAGTPGTMFPSQKPTTPNNPQYNNNNTTYNR